MSRMAADKRDEVKVPIRAYPRHPRLDFFGSNGRAKNLWITHPFLTSSFNFRDFLVFRGFT